MVEDREKARRNTVTQLIPASRSHFVGVGNLMAEISLEVSKKEYDEIDASYNLIKGNAIFISKEETDIFLNAWGYAGGKTKYSFKSGGATALSVINCSLLGGTSVLAGVVGNDEFGKRYKSYVENLRIKHIIQTHDVYTSVAISLITPDRERTFIDYVLNYADISLFTQEIKEWFLNAKVVGFEGYGLYDENLAKQYFELMHEVRENGVLTFLDMNDVGVPKRLLDKFIDSGALSIFSLNNYEAKSYCNSRNPHDIFDKIDSSIDIILTLGRKGVTIRFDGKIETIPTKEKPIKSLLGAGDTFKGAFIRGLLAKKDSVTSAKLGNLAAGKIIQLEGGILPNQYNGEVDKFFGNPNKYYENPHLIDF